MRLLSPARLAAGVTAAAALVLVGCIKLHDDATVTADGSGSYTESLVIDLSAMKGIADAMGGMMGPQDGAPGMGEGKSGGLDEDPLEKLKKQWKDIEGLEVTKAESTTKDGKVTVDVAAKFKTLEAYAKATGIEMNAELKKNDDGSYTLTFSGDEKMGPPAGEAAMGDAPMDGAAMEDPGAALGAMILPMLEGFMKDLEMKRVLKVPGTIVETNGTKGDDGSTVTWKFDFETLKKTQGMPSQTVTFKGEGLDLKPFKIQRDHDAGGGMPGGMPEGK